MIEGKSLENWEKEEREKTRWHLGRWFAHGFAFGCGLLIAFWIGAVVAFGMWLGFVRGLLKALSTP